MGGVVVFDGLRLRPGSLVNEREVYVGRVFVSKGGTGKELRISSIGGLGKTSLVKMVFNNGKVGDHFDLKMWVCISDKFELKVMVEKTIEAAT
ncbi:hypothetical protein Goari_001951 [Gossypium aridum]|uniref:NB-ARC domain-containing protein n=1 Tax=Gossypium aridum TaxID=34290 RepID=A0A7J8Y7R2_GOSAI|nr:hypothetical protein [Gossypium aridum]